MSEDLCFKLGGVKLIPDLSGAIYAPEHRTLLIADLHLEKGSSLARRGVHLPPYDTRASLALLHSVLNSCMAERLVFLGDSFHDGEALKRIDAADLLLLQSITSRVETIWIAGNHDPVPPAGAGGQMVQHLALGAVTLRHIPSPLVDGGYEIAGHLHPAAGLSQRGRYIRCKCFIGDKQRLIMPAFGIYTGSLSISAEPIASLFKNSPFHVWMLGNQGIYHLPGRRVR